ncbi:MAG: glycosyltransferase [Planctomycetes bacterium]|nr:glycosyltransferase [Planctomycetota bacterium]
MRILLFPMGSHGDVHPFLGLGRALQARNHEVFIITSAYFETAVRAAGLEFRPVGTADDYVRVTKDPNLWHPTRAFETLVEKAVNHSYQPVMQHAADLNKPGETVMAAGSLAWATRNARDKLGIPLATIHLAPSLFISSYRIPLFHGAPAPQWAPRWLKELQWKIATRVSDKAVLPGLNRFRRELGLAPAKRIIRQWWHSPDRVLGLFPDWFGPPQPDWPPHTQLTGFPMFDEREARRMPDELSAWLNQGEPPVVFTPGSAMAHGHGFFAQAAEAMKLLGRRGLLMTQYAETVPKQLPQGVRHFEWAPFSELLPRAAALVYHGGVGTCAQALRASVPHLVMHMAHDQLDNLSRVRDLGVGDGGPPKRFKARWIADRLQSLTGDAAVKQRCADVAARFDVQGWMRKTCELVETTSLRQ